MEKSDFIKFVENMARERFVLYGPHSRMQSDALFARLLKETFVESYMDETGCSEDEAYDALENDSEMQSLIAVYTYSGRA